MEISSGKIALMLKLNSTILFVISRWITVEIYFHIDCEISKQYCLSSQAAEKCSGLSTLRVTSSHQDPQWLMSIYLSQRGPLTEVSLEIVLCWEERQDQGLTDWPAGWWVLQVTVRLTVRFPNWRLETTALTESLLHCCTATFLIKQEVGPCKLNMIIRRISRLDLHYS